MYQGFEQLDQTMSRSQSTRRHDQSAMATFTLDADGNALDADGCAVDVRKIKYRGCGQYGHWVKDCPSAKDKRAEISRAAGRTRGGVRAKGNLICFHCGIVGHTSSQCRAKDRGQPQTEKGKAAQQK